MSDQSRAHAARLVILVSSDRRRGAEVFGETLRDGLRGRGWDVGLVSLTTSPDGPRVAATPLSALPPDDIGKLDRKVVRSLRKHVSGVRPDLVLANGAATMQYAVAALRLMRRRPGLVYTSIGEPMYWIRSSYHRVLRTFILKGVDRVLSVSSTTARQLVDQLGVPAAKVRVAPTGVPARFFDVPAASRSAGEPLNVVFVGNLSDEKDPLAAIDVIASVAEAAPIRMRFLGGGPLLEDVKRAAADRKLGDAVEVLGSVPDVLPHLEWADVLLLTSRTEGLPGVPLEAGAAAVASVVYDVGGAAETVTDGVTGRVVHAGDLRAAADALIEMAQDSELCTRMGLAARHMVRERFTLEASLDRYNDLLTDEMRARGAAADAEVVR